jgi:hypothetical protein
MSSAHGAENTLHWAIGTQNGALSLRNEWALSLGSEQSALILIKELLALNTESKKWSCELSTKHSVLGLSTKQWTHKVRTHKEYHSVCPSSELGPTPHPQASVPPPPCFWGEGNTRWRERGCESPNSDEGHTLCNSLYVCTLWVNPSYLAPSSQYWPWVRCSQPRNSQKSKTC